MTDREKAIVMAYTGKCMLTGDKLHIFYRYVEEIMGRPVYTHEMAIKSVDDEIREKSKADFVALCKEQEPETGHWIATSERLPEIQEHVLLCLRSHIDVGFRGATEPYFYCYGVDSHYVEPQNVLAWMPLPAPFEPKERSE